MSHPLWQKASRKACSKWGLQHRGVQRRRERGLHETGEGLAWALVRGRVVRLDLDGVVAARGLHHIQTKHQNNMVG